MGRADELRLSILIGLRKGLTLIRGMRRSLTGDEHHKIAGAIVEHLGKAIGRLKGPSREGSRAESHVQMTKGKGEYFGAGPGNHRLV